MYTVWALNFIFSTKEMKRLGGLSSMPFTIRFVLQSCVFTVPGPCLIDDLSTTGPTWAWKMRQGLSYQYWNTIQVHYSAWSLAPEKPLTTWLAGPFFIACWNGPVFKHMSVRSLIYGDGELLQSWWRLLRRMKQSVWVISLHSYYIRTKGVGYYHGGVRCWNTLCERIWEKMPLHPRMHLPIQPKISKLERYTKIILLHHH